MADNDLTQGGTDQAVGATKPGGQGQTGGGDDSTGAIGGDTGTQPGGQAGSAENLGPDNLPPELEETRKALLRDYHEKTQKQAGERKQWDDERKQLKGQTEVLQRLFEEPWFKKAYDAEKKARSGESLAQDLSEEQAQELASDPRKLVQFVQKSLETILENKIGPALKQTGSAVRDLKTEREKERLVAEHPEFKGAFDSGALESYLDKGYGLEAAFAMHQLKQGRRDLKSEAEKEAERILAARRAGSVEKGGAPRVNGVQVLKANNLNEALDAAFAARSRGVTDFRLERK